MAQYMYAWEYDVAPEHEPAFLRAYGPDGDWVQLFRRAPGYLRTELFRDIARPGRFVTLDYWETPEAFAAFRARFAKEFEALDVRCEALTVREAEIGRFGVMAP
jgi:heme-degrading monooxygenase HmoA